MDEMDHEYATLSRPRTAALRSFETLKHKMGGNMTERERRERRLKETAYEVLGARTERDLSVPPGSLLRGQVGLGAVLCGDVVGELVGRTYDV